jgi:hypothetical protein
MKMLDMYIPRCPSFNIPYKIEDFEIYKTLDASGSLATMEDLVKLDEPLYVSKENFFKKTYIILIFLKISFLG